MPSFSLSRFADILQAHLIGRDKVFRSVSIDTRTLKSGELFVALKGDNFDGHDFLGQAQAKGAVAAMVARRSESALSQLLVADTRLGLGALAAAWRDSVPVPLVAVTGSNGKTTVKEMLEAILTCRGKVLATRGNMNNEIGMPLTLLRLQDEAYAVIEMGASGPGEIAYLSRIAQPQVVVLNNTGRAHLEGFGNMEAVARAKGEIITGLSTEGTVVINEDDHWSGLWRQLAGNHKVLTFGVDHEADIRIEPKQVQTVWSANGFNCEYEVRTPLGEIRVNLNLGGYHNVLNSMAAIAAAIAIGANVEQITRGLASIKPVKGRLQTRIAPSGLRIIDDTYNANPDSVRAAIDLLATAPGKRWLILGDLAELGADSESLHAELGTRAREAGLEHLYSLGCVSEAATIAFGEGAKHFAERRALLQVLGEQIGRQDCILVKGSRSAAMEHVVEALLKIPVAEHVA